MYYYVAFWTSVTIVKVSYDAAFTNCLKKKMFKLGCFRDISKIVLFQNVNYMLTCMKTFCNGSCIY